MVENYLVDNFLNDDSLNTLLKVWGERNSGTNYLQYILELNFKEFVYEHHQELTESEAISSGFNIMHFWKHSIPQPHIYTFFRDKRVINIFIIRDLESWLISTYNMHHGLIKCNSFLEFITQPQQWNADYGDATIWDAIFDEPINLNDDDKTIFEIRYYKLLHILEFINTNDDCVLVSLTYLQNNFNSFLDHLEGAFDLTPKQGERMDYLEHTKSGQLLKEYGLDPQIQNIVYPDPEDIEEFKEIINFSKRENMENIVNNLFIKTKNGVILEF